MEGWLDAGRSWLERLSARGRRENEAAATDAPRPRRARRFRLEAGTLHEVEGLSSKVPARRLEDPERTIQIVYERTKGEVGALLEELQALRDTFAPDPLVLFELVRTLRRLGHGEAALEIAREALPLCFRHKQGMLAARLLEEMDADAHALGFGRDELIAMGAALAPTEQWETAFQALAACLMKNPEDVKVTEALLRMADRHLANARNPEEGWKVAQFLSVVVSDPRLLERVDERLRVAERQMSEAVHTRTTQPIARPDL
jgi:hypothetical protein